MVWSESGPQRGRSGDDPLSPDQNVISVSTWDSQAVSDFRLIHTMLRWL